MSISDLTQHSCSYVLVNATTSSFLIVPFTFLLKKMSRLSQTDYVTVSLTKNREDGPTCRIALSSSTATDRLYLCNIPTFLPVPELLRQCEPLLKYVLKIRLVCTSIPETYGAIVYLEDAARAEQLRMEINMKPVSALAREALLVSFIKPSESDAAVEDCDSEVETLMQRSSAVDGTDRSDRTPTPHQPGRSVTPQQGTPVMSPTRVGLPDVVNLCTICLEPLAGAAPLNTLCGHQFHIRCFAQIEDDSCPLCRYNMATDSLTATCGECGITDDLWMCLICGETNCGRYRNSHAQAHFSRVKHPLAMQVGGFRDWDFVADSFVHRLLATDDGSFAEANKTANGTVAWWAMDDEEEAELEKAKLESKTEFISDYYSNVLASQLQQQSEFYEAKLATATQNSEEHSLFRSEARDRKAIAQHYVSEYKKVISTFRTALTGVHRREQTTQRKIKEDLDTLAATVESLREGNAKCRALLELTQDPNRLKKQTQPLHDQIAQLEKELEEVYSKFA